MTQMYTVEIDGEWDTVKEAQQIVDSLKKEYGIIARIGVKYIRR